MNGTGTLRTKFRGVKKELLERQTSMLIQSMTVDELYLEVLYEILHNVGGCDVGCEVGQLAMLSYIQEAFKIANDKHTELLTQAEAKEPPELMLNVEVVEAKDLVPKDPNGLSDPFVTIYLMSNPSHRYNTSVKSGTLNPSWEEHFSLPMPGSVQEDSLVLEVWDFDPAETVKEKMTKIFEVKGVKGLRKLMKEIAITASTGKHDNELIGTSNIPLKSIPAGGMNMWYSLSKKSKLRRQGVVKVRLNFSSEKNSQVAAQEHRHLLRIILLHELENSKVAPYWWCGNYSAAAEAILTQHVAQSGLSATDNCLAQWAVYCAVTTDHPLSFALFNTLLDKLTKPLQSGLINEEDVKLFWDGARKLLPTCYSHIRKLRKKTAGDKTVMKTLREVLKILYKLSVLDAPESLDLFPVNLYGWLRDDKEKLTIHMVLEQAVIQGASDWFVHILDNNECKDNTEDTRLQHLIRVIQLVRSDLQRAVEYYDRVFVEVMGFPYSKALYGLYESKLASLVESEVVDVCKSLKRLRYSEGSTTTLAGGINGETGLGASSVGSEPLTMGTTLFELYLTLQRFLTLGQGLNETDWQSYAISKFHAWFFGGVAQWLDIAAYKALTRIEKAVDLDTLAPVDTNVKYSSSGVDTLAIFYQIKIFWQQLAWPDVEGCYTFVAKIIDDICRCCVFYSDKMASRVDNVGVVTSVYEERFEVTTDWCVAINNIDMQLPVQTLLQLYKEPTSNSFIINFSIIYITMGFPRLPREQQLSLAPSLLQAIENKPQGHQDGILMLVMPLLGDIKETDLNLKEKPKVANLILKFATDVLLLPYRALPNPGESEFQVPPGMSMKTYKRIIDKNQLNPNQLEEMKLSIVNFIGKDIFNMNDTLLTLIVAAADSRFSVANHANSPLIRVNSSVDWSSPSVVAPLYSLYLGTWGGMKVPPDDRKVPACTRLRLKLIQYLNKATGPAIMFPHCVQVVFSSLFDPNTNSRLRNQALVFLLNVINSGDEVQLKKVATVFLQGLLKLIRSDEHSEQHPKAYMCLGRLAMKCPDTINNQFALLEELVKKIPDAVPEMKTALRDALLEMSAGFKINAEAAKADAPRSSTAGTSQGDKMEVDDGSKTSPFDEPQALALFALLDHYMHSEESMIRYIAMRYSAAVFPQDYVPSRYLLLLASGDSQDDISTEALKCLYGTSRPSEIEDAVFNVSKKETAVVNIDEDGSKKDKDRAEENQELKVPKFSEVVNYVWDQMQKRKKGSNAKHRFVIGNQVLQFHPLTYQEILRYMRMCLNRDASLKDCSNHPNATSPLLAKYFYDNLLDTEVLERYLTMITSLLNASPEIMPLSCFLDIIGCVPEKMASKYTSLLPFLRNLFTTSTKEDIRDISAVIYAIITVHTSEKSAIDKEIKEFVAQGQNNKSLEAQCGYLSAFSNLCERCIVLSKRAKFGGKGFNPANWEPYQEGAVVLANFLASSQTMLVSTSCSAISLLARCSGLPLPPSSAKQDALLQGDNPFNINKSDTNVDDNDVTKFAVADRLFKVVGNAKLPSKLKERALYTLGLLCCGERLPFAKQIVMGFLQMAKDSKEFEIHLQIGESLVLCVEGVNSNENRDLWTELPKEGAAKIKNTDALKENDELLEWLLKELFKIGRHPHPHSRQATSIWLLALLKNCADRAPIKNKLPILQDVFMDFLSENSDIVQDVASKGLSLVYQNSDESQKQALVGQIIEQLTSGKRSVAQVTEDTKIFEEGQLGKAPTGGNLSTYKELCSLASDLNQPDLLYKFMHLAHHNSMWNSKKGAAFGFHSIALQAGAQLSEHLPKIVPRLYRYRFDPTPRIQNSMQAIWHAIVPNTTATVHKYHKEILDDLVANLTSGQWRVRMSCCNALADLLRGAQSLHQSLEQLPTIWLQLFRVMDDVHEGTRQAATSTANVLSKLCIRAADANAGKDGKEVVSVILPVLLDTGITNLVKEVRSVSLQTVSKLVTAAGETLKPFLARLIPALAGAAGELESARLSYLATALADSTSRDVLDDMRASAAKHHYTTDTVVKCMPYVDIEVMKEMLPKILELMKSPQLGTKVACCHFVVLAAHYLRADLEPVAGKIMANLLTGTFDRNATVRKNYAEALGQVSAYAKLQSAEKLMKKLVTLYETKEDDMSRSAIALCLKSISKAKIEHIKDNEDVLAPMVFLAMHGPKDEDSSTVEMFEEIWTDISPARESGIKLHLTLIREEIEKCLNSSSWTKKIQAANAIKTICKEVSSGLGAHRELLVRGVLAAVHGKTFDGKEHVLMALADLCAVKENEQPLSQALATEVINALLVESRKQEMTYKRHAITALGHAIHATHCDRFQQLYDIVKVILSKDELSVGKESDEEDNEGARQRREQLTALKEAAYELLGKAWPKEPETQEKYQDLFFEHCSKSYPTSSRSTQLAILASVTRVLERLAILANAGEPMDTDNPNNRDKAIATVTGHVTLIIDYTLQNSNQVRHRRDALNIMEILVKQLKDLNKTEELDKLRTIYQSYAQDLSRDSSHEIRTKVENIKVHFK